MTDPNYYDSISEGYEELHGEEQKKKISLIQNKFLPNEEQKLLDVGCGTGLTTRCWNCIRTGVDPAGKLLEKARQKDKEGTYVQAPAEELPFEDNSFDIVTSITAIQNFEDIKKGIEEIKRVGKDKFILSYLKRSPKADDIENHIQNIFDVKERIEEDKDIILII